MPFCPEHEAALFALIAEKPVAEREAIFKVVCGNDEALRRRLEALLAAHDAPITGLDGGPAVARVPASAAEAIALTRMKTADDESVGQTLGRYKLLEKVGEGGCGVVYVAEQTEPVRRRVALKVIKLGMDTRDVVARFEAERQALAMMDHPNIARVFDAGATETGRPYFVMELVRGIRITDYCDEARLSTADRLNLFINVCHAVQHAHQKGVIHRDLKPSNILVTLHDGVPVPKVIDFGIAKATGERLTNATIYTQLHQFIGTPAYMSPEQAEMSGLDIDTRSDVYSLGVLLYELLAGSPPFDAKTLLASGLDAMRRTIREVEPPRPSTRLSALKGEERTTTAKRRSADAAKLVHQLQGDLDWIIMKCLEKDRSRRYETANGLATDLKRHLSNEPVSARSPSTAYRFQKAWRRNKLAFSAAAAVALAVIAGAVVSYIQADRARQAEALAKARLDDAEDIAAFLTKVFESPDPTRDGREIKATELLDRAARIMESELADQPARRTKMRAVLGNTSQALGLYHQAIPMQESVRDYYLATLGKEHPDTLEAMHNLATSLDLAGRESEALGMREEVLSVRRRVLGPEHPATLAAMNKLGESLSDDGRLDEALKLWEDGLRLSREVLGPEHRTTVEAMHNVAVSLTHTARAPEGIKLLEEALRLMRKVLGPAHPDTLGGMHNLADSLSRSGRKVEAISILEDSLSLHQRVFGGGHHFTLKVMGSLAYLRFDAGRFDDAIKSQQETLSLMRTALGAEHPDTLLALATLALYFFDSGRREEALILREEAVPTIRKALGPEDPVTLDATDQLAMSLFDAGRRKEALTMWEDVLPLMRKTRGPEHRQTLAVMQNLAAAWFDAGRKKEAVALQQEVLPLMRRVLGAGDRLTLAAMAHLAYSSFHTGRPTEAVRLWEEALPLMRKILGPEDPQTLSVIQCLAIAYDAAGRDEEARPFREELMALRRNLKPTEPIPGLMSGIGVPGPGPGPHSVRQIIQPLEKSLEDIRKSKGPGHPDTIAAMTALAAAFGANGSGRKSIPLGEEALMLARKTFPAGDPRIVEVMRTLVPLYRMVELEDQARKLEAELGELAKPEPR